MDDEKAVGMTTDAKPLPLSAEELEGQPRVNTIVSALLNWKSISADDALYLDAWLVNREVTIARVERERDLARATIAQKDEQIERLRESIAGTETADYLESRDGHMNALKGESLAMRETIKTALCVLCAAEHGQSWSINMMKDFNIAIGMCRAALNQRGDNE